MGKADLREETGKCYSASRSPLVGAVSFSVYVHSAKGQFIAIYAFTCGHRIEKLRKNTVSAKQRKVKKQRYINELCTLLEGGLGECESAQSLCIYCRSVQGRFWGTVKCYCHRECREEQAVSPGLISSDNLKCSAIFYTY